MEEKRAVVLEEARMGLAEYERQDFVVTAAEGTSIADVHQPGYWAFTASKFKRFDHIEVRQETGEWIANFVVLDCGKNWARVHEVSVYELAPPSEEPAIANAHEVKWKGPHHKFSVIRKSDQSSIQSGFVDKAGADAWLANYDAVR